LTGGSPSRKEYTEKGVEGGTEGTEDVNLEVLETSQVLLKYERPGDRPIRGTET